MSEAAAPTETGNVVDRFVGEHHHDDRIDVDTEISSAEALGLLWRCIGLLGRAKALFAAKFVLQTGTLFFQLFMPWIGKIVIDNVILQKPIGETDVPYPPFMRPIVNFLDGMTPLEIMFTLAMGYLAALILIGFRAGELNVDSSAARSRVRTRRPRRRTRSAVPPASRAACGGSWSTRSACA